MQSSQGGLDMKAYSTDLRVRVPAESGKGISRSRGDRQRPSRWYGKSGSPVAWRRRAAVLGLRHVDDQCGGRRPLSFIDTKDAMMLRAEPLGSLRQVH